MLFYLNGLNCSINWEQNLGLLGKDIICGRKTGINIVKGIIPDLVWKINGALKTIYRYYKSKIIGEITSIGIKGFFGNFTKIFGFVTADKFSKDAVKWKRPSSVFYDKYKCFKSYNETDI